jgi:hypothetical protein
MNGLAVFVRSSIFDFNGQCAERARKERRAVIAGQGNAEDLHDCYISVYSFLTVWEISSI